MVTRVSKEGRIVNYIIYMFCDMLERLIPFAKHEASRANIEFKKRDLQLLNELFYVAKDLRKATRDITIESQEDFGETSDFMLTMILLLMDRIGENKAKEIIVKDFVERLNSEEKINIKRII